MKIFFILLFVLPLAFGTSLCAQDSVLLLKARKKLEQGSNVSGLLQDPQFDSIRPETEFRDLIRNHASQDKLIIVTDSEPGVRIIVKGVLLDKHLKTVPDKMVYIYQTDHRGWYGSDRGHFQMMQGDRNHARLFGYVKTDAAGKFELHTIQPQGYPQSDLPAHIHIEIFDSTGKALLISELLFDDDDRLKGETRSRSEREGFYIAKPEKSGKVKIYNYNISIERYPG